MMSTFDHYEKQADPTPRIRRLSGPFDGSLKTVAAALAFCEANGLDPSEVRLAHNYVSWDREETPEEVEARVASARKRQADHVASIERIHAEYVERGLTHTTPPAKPASDPESEGTP